MIKTGTLTTAQTAIFFSKAISHDGHCQANLVMFIIGDQTAVQRRGSEYCTILKQWKILCTFSKIHEKLKISRSILMCSQCLFKSNNFLKLRIIISLLRTIILE